MTRSPLVVAAAAVLVGAVGVSLAHDIRSWRDSLRDDALRVSAAPPKPVVSDTGLLLLPKATPLRLTASTALPSSLSARLLSVGRDREWLKALQAFSVAYRVTQPLDGLGQGAYGLLNAGTTALTKVTQDADPARASQAYNLLAILVFREAYPGTGVDPSFVQRSLTDFQNSVRLDPTNVSAKTNLELAYRVLVAEHGVEKQGRAAGTHATKNRKGAYGGPPGQGY